MLGLVGLVIGGIWVAASTVTASLKMRNAVQGIIFTATSLQNGISGSQGLAIGEGVNIGATAIRAGWVPADWVNGTTLTNPIGTTVSLANYNGGGVPRFDIGMRGVARADCIKLVSAISSFEKSTATAWTDNLSLGLIFIQILNATTPYTSYASFPVIPTSTACVVANNDVFFTFKYTRSN